MPDSALAVAPIAAARTSLRAMITSSRILAVPILASFCTGMAGCRGDAPPTDLYLEYREEGGFQGGIRDAMIVTTDQQIDWQNVPDASGLEEAHRPRIIVVSPDTAGRIVRLLRREGFFEFLSTPPGGWSDVVEGRLSVVTADQENEVVAFYIDSRDRQPTWRWLARVVGRVRDIAESEGTPVSRPPMPAASTRPVEGPRVPDVPTVALVPGGSVAALGDRPGGLELWDVVAGKPLQPTEAPAALIYAPCFSADGRVVAGVGTDGAVRVWQVKTGKCVRVFAARPRDTDAVALNADGTLLAGVGGGGATVWSVSTGDRLMRTTSQAAVLTSVALSGDGRFMAAGSRFLPTTFVWEVPRGRLAFELGGHTQGITALRFSPNGKSLASGSADWTVRIWDVRRGTQIGLLSGHTRPVWALAFSGDGRFIAAGAGNGRIKVWNLEDKSLVNTMFYRGRIPTAVEFTPEGDVLTAAAEGGFVSRWNISEARLLSETDRSLAPGGRD